jgi:hypothetical protein
MEEVAATPQARRHRKRLPEPAGVEEEEEEDVQVERFAQHEGSGCAGGVGGIAE